MNAETFLRCTLYAFIFVFGCLGNLFVIVFFNSKRLRGAPQFRWLMIHLAVADGVYTLLSPSHLVYLVATNNKWNLGVAACKASKLLGPVTVNVSAWLLCLMAHERYRAICYPFSRRWSTAHIHRLVAGVWIVCIALKSFTLSRSQVIDEECFVAYNSTNEQMGDVLTAFLAESMLPNLILTYYLVRVYFTLQRREQRFTRRSSVDLYHQYRSRNRNNKFPQHVQFQRSVRYKQTRTSTTVDTDTLLPSRSSSNCSTGIIGDCMRQRQDSRTVSVFVVAVCLFVLLTFPFNLYHVIVVYLYSHYFTRAQILAYQRALFLANDWLAMLVLSSSVVNVLVYCGKFPAFRRNIYEWLTQDRCKCAKRAQGN